MADKELAEILAVRAVDHLRMWGLQYREMDWYDVSRHVDGFCGCTVQSSDVDLQPMSIEAECNIAHTIVIHDFINLAKFLSAVNRIDYKDFEHKLRSRLKNEMNRIHAICQQNSTYSPELVFFSKFRTKPPSESPCQKAFRERMREAYERERFRLTAEIDKDDEVVREALKKARQETDEPAQKKARFEKPAEE